MCETMEWKNALYNFPHEISLLPESRRREVKRVAIFSGENSDSSGGIFRQVYYWWGVRITGYVKD